MSNTADKFQGCLLGLAIGDALGFEVEFSSIEAINKRFGPGGIRDLVVDHKIQGKLVARFSDDTQMSLAVCRGLLRSGKGKTCDELAPVVAEEFIEWACNPPDGHRAPGGACMAGCNALQAGAWWEQAGARDAGGCGTAMRSAPYALYFVNDYEGALECAARHAKMTHGHKLAAAASAAVAAGVLTALHADAAILTSPHTIFRAMVDAAARYDDITARMLLDVQMRVQRLWRLQESLSPDSWNVERERSRVDALDKWRGWAGHEAVAAALYCFLTNVDDFEQCMIDAANSPGDSDSVASIAGALAGAYLGRSKIPEKWVAVIERRDELINTADALVDTANAPKEL